MIAFACTVIKCQKVPEGLPDSSGRSFYMDIKEDQYVELTVDEKKMKLKFTMRNEGENRNGRFVPFPKGSWLQVFSPQTFDIYDGDDQDRSTYQESTQGESNY